MVIPSPRSTRRARIEIVPLIDIIFFLLATFVMVSMSMIKNAGIDVQLPSATSGTPHERSDYTSISLNADSEIFVNKERVEMPELVTRLASLKQREADPRVFINGDERSSFGVAVAVLDEARKLGIQKVAIETKPRQGD